MKTPHTKPSEIIIHDTTLETFEHSFQLEWGSNYGFGQFWFTVGDDGLVHIDNECMSKEFIKAVLCKMVDDAVLDD